MTMEENVTLRSAGTLARRVTRRGKTVRVASCGFGHAFDHYDGAGRNLSVNGL